MLIRNYGAAWALVAMISFLGLGALISLWNQTPQQQQYHSHNQYRAEENLHKIATIPNVLLVSVERFVAHTLHSFHKLKDDWIAVATIMLALITAGLLWIAGRQITTSRAQLRAYIGPEIFPDDTEIIVFDQNKEITIPIRLVNRGQTPAHGVTHRVVIGLAPFPPIEEIPFDTSEPSSFPIVIGPGANILITAHFPKALTAPEQTALRKGTWRVYIGGRVNYRDVFKRPQFSTYRMSLSFRVDGTLRGIETAERGNDSS
jgi:hypothetical protein